MNPIVQSSPPDIQPNLSATDSPEKKPTYQFGFLDSFAKKEIRRSLLKAVAIPVLQELAA